MCSENQAFARQLASWSSVAVKHSGMDLNAASRVLRAKLEDFFGEEELAHSDGAGGQNRTGYARLFRAALYQ